MMTRPLGKTGFSIAPLVFGGNVFGWTIDEKTSFALLDAFVDHGFDAIDTADVYSRWAEGNQGGESETIIGRWLQARPGMRDKVKIFTKVGSDLGLPGHKGLSKAWIQQAVDDSLRRLNTDYIDLYFSHWPDPQTPVAETLEAFHSLQQAGKIRAMGASNLDAMQLAGALEVARKGGLPAWQVLQPEYNLYHRSAFEGALCDLCVSRDIGVVTYYSLASGFLTGKYRQPSDLTQSQRGSGIGKYLNPRGMRIIDTLAAVADEQGAKPAEVALAWLIGREGVTAPIASATSVAQVESFARAAALSLANSEDVRSSLELYGEGEFSRVRLCYMAEVRENDAAHVRLLPIWEFQGVFTGETGHYQITCLVSALSGEVIDSPNSEVLLRERE